MPRHSSDYFEFFMIPVKMYACRGFTNIAHVTALNSLISPSTPRCVCVWCGFVCVCLVEGRAGEGREREISGPHMAVI